MFDIAAPLCAWLAEGRRVAVATVVAVHGSAPRPAGTSMAVDESGAVLGSLSGGCVEGTVHALCLDALDGAPPLVVELGSGDGLYVVGPTCGGSLDVLVHTLDDWSDDARLELARAAQGRPARLGVSVGTGQTGTDQTGTDQPGTDQPGTDHARASVGATMFWETQHEPPRLVVVGATQEAVALCDVASMLGYRVTVCDPRPVFATKERFPSADSVVAAWPTTWLEAAATAGEFDARTVLCLVTHDDRFEVPVLAWALRQGLAYVGAMGSRRTHERRMAELVAEGLPEETLAALHSPIGLDVGASTPHETALSILAEVVATRTGRSAEPLRTTRGPLHPPHDV